MLNQPEKRAWDKHSSLFCHTSCDEETSYIRLTPAHVTVRHFPFRPRKSDESLKTSKFGRCQFRETALRHVKSNFLQKQLIPYHVCHCKSFPLQSDICLQGQEPSLSQTISKCWENVSLILKRSSLLERRVYQNHSLKGSNL